MDRDLSRPKFPPLEKEKKTGPKSAHRNNKNTPDLTKRGNSNIVAQDLFTVEAPIIGSCVRSLILFYSS